MTAVIEVDHLHKRYDDNVAVGDVSFAVNEGEIFGILGANGAGKTTTVAPPSTARAGSVTSRPWGSPPAAATSRAPSPSS